MMLETPRLVLRDLCAEDAAALNEIERDPGVTRYMSFDPQSPEQTRTYLEETVRLQQETPRRTFDFAIVPRGESAQSDAGKLVGRCGLGVRRPQHFEAEMWYLLHPAQHGRGYASEAAAALLDFALSSLGLHRIWADCDPRNLASCRVATRLGMQLEGVLRENYWLKGEWCSSNIYAILAGEWEARSSALRDNRPGVRM